MDLVLKPLPGDTSCTQPLNAASSSAASAPVLPAALLQITNIRAWRKAEEEGEAGYEVASKAKAPFPLCTHLTSASRSAG